MGQRLDQLERVVSEREWLVGGRFTVADQMAHFEAADQKRAEEGSK